MSSAKRTSLKQTNNPLDVLFTKTEIEDGKSEVGEKKTDARKSGDGFAMLIEEIKQKKQKHLRLEEEKEAMLRETRKARKRATQTKRQTTLIIYDYQMDWLEMKRAETRIRGGRPVSMAKLLRAMMDLLIESSIDLSGARTVEEIKKRLKQGITRGE